MIAEPGLRGRTLASTARFSPPRVASRAVFVPETEHGAGALASLLSGLQVLPHPLVQVTRPVVHQI